MAPENEPKVYIPVDDGVVEGTLVIPSAAQGIIVFVYDRGNARPDPKHMAAARALGNGRLAILLLDLLSADEEARYDDRFDIDLLARRLIAATRWVRLYPDLNALPIGYLGSGTGAAAALKAASMGEIEISAIVSCSGRPDLAGAALRHVRPPTLLIVGSEEDVVVEMNQQAYEMLTAPKRLVMIPKATRLFDEPNAMGEAARLANEWFSQYLIFCSE